MKLPIRCTGRSQPSERWWLLLAKIETAIVAIQGFSVLLETLNNPNRVELLAWVAEESPEAERLLRDMFRLTGRLETRVADGHWDGDPSNAWVVPQRVSYDEAAKLLWGKAADAALAQLRVAKAGHLERSQRD